MLLCEQCGKEHDGTFGSGRFCSRSCSNKWVALHQSPEAKARKSKVGSSNLIHSSSFSAKYWTEERRKSHSQKVSGYKMPEDARSRISKSLSGRVLSESTRSKISESMLKAVAEGRHKGYQYSKRPYSEVYVESILSSRDIRYERQFRYEYLDEAGRKRFFFLDFYLPDYNLDLEVDGSFHSREPQIYHDQRRDQIISEEMEIFRLRWNKVGSQELLSEIDRFLKYISMR